VTPRGGGFAHAEEVFDEMRIREAGEGLVVMLPHSSMQGKHTNGYKQTNKILAQPGLTGQGKQTSPVAPVESA
jgi:hypothetical protein